LIYIDKDNVNRFVLTLNENSRLQDPYYVFSFTNEYNLEAESILFYTPNISNFTCRYDQFELIEDNSGSKTGGIDIPLSLVTGQYKYQVYETSILPEEPLSISNTTGRIVEEGRMVVSGNDEEAQLGNDSLSDFYS
jgi:hypothetical protein